MLDGVDGGYLFIVKGGKKELNMVKYVESTDMTWGPHLVWVSMTIHGFGPSVRGN